MQAKVKFVSYEKFNELVMQNPNSDHSSERGLLVSGIMYRHAGGDDWRRVDVDEYCFRGSCDTANGFIFNDKTKEFALVNPYFYDELVNSTNTTSTTKAKMKQAFYSAKYKGTFTKFELFKNKASGMVVNIKED